MLRTQHIFQNQVNQLQKLDEDTRKLQHLAR
jgi:hypothetical protein